MPTFIYFFTVPFAQSEMLGKNTFYITVAGTIVSYVFAAIVSIYGVGTSLLVPMLTPIWEAKVNAYLQSVRKILIMENFSSRNNFLSLITIKGTQRRAN